MYSVSVSKLEAMQALFKSHPIRHKKWRNPKYCIYLDPFWKKVMHCEINDDSIVSKFEYDINRLNHELSKDNTDVWEIIYLSQNDAFIEALKQV